ncbi:hypothetical protein ACJX0J_035999, partial [Zea mays]
SCLAARIYTKPYVQTVEVFSIAFSQLSEAAAAVITGTAVATTATTTISFSAAVAKHLCCKTKFYLPVNHHLSIFKKVYEGGDELDVCYFLYLPNTNILPIASHTASPGTLGNIEHVYQAAYKALEEAVPEDLAVTISNGPYKEREPESTI